MHRIVLVVSTAWIALGCGGGGGNDLTTEAGKLRDQMCACTDRPCVARVDTAYTGWRDAQAARVANLSAAERQRLQSEHGAALARIDRDLAACRQNAAAAPLWASCQTKDNQRCNEWAGVHWQLAGADDAQREAATRNTCENYTRGVYRPGERCRRVGIVGACVHRENVAFAYSDRAAAVKFCTMTDGGVPVGTWHDAAEAATF